MQLQEQMNCLGKMILTRLDLKRLHGFNFQNGWITPKTVENYMVAFCVLPVPN